MSRNYAYEKPTKGHVSSGGNFLNCRAWERRAPLHNVPLGDWNSNQSVIAQTLREEFSPFWEGNFQPVCRVILLSSVWSLPNKEFCPTMISIKQNAPILCDDMILFPQLSNSSWCIYDCWRLFTFVTFPKGFTFDNVQLLYSQFCLFDTGQWCFFPAHVKRRLEAWICILMNWQYIMAPRHSLSVWQFRGLSQNQNAAPTDAKRTTGTNDFTRTKKWKTERKQKQPKDSLPFGCHPGFDVTMWTLGRYLNKHERLTPNWTPSNDDAQKWRAEP